ncbi:sulfite exporter TauE/SafE family protein [Lacihabitans sp. LS3-19]|uniref:sulfite exporter TauE/SafE family protein n=1 Tax=Lacihabitans sp. LS3-19 TaxID=2487335 RepID=UPI0020CCD877|nr:sulfite exporter TauE/SafE family protein [Lacihabitans sp. LS3-19]MCP9766305.1 sulfite exporter TauE/SafE family protein [Lacihabitans sp. LS3-19]
MQIVFDNAQLLLLFFGIALLYSSVGFGGGSSYLAVMTLFNIDFKILRSISLLCNLTVVSNGTLQFYKKGFLNLKKVGPLVFVSVPMAFIGGLLPISEKLFFIVLGITLFIAAILMWFQPQSKVDFSTNLNEKVWFNAVLGGSIGFLSGMVGIGGGIFLSPVLNMLNWDKPKNIAATASFFILVNSLSGLLGQSKSLTLDFPWTLALALMVAVGIGGFIGTYLATNKFTQVWVRKATAILIAYVSYNVLRKYI